jgi:hypothetical protein
MCFYYDWVVQLAPYSFHELNLLKTVAALSACYWSEVRPEFGVSNLALKPKKVLEQTSYRITNETFPSNDKEKSPGVKPFNLSQPQDS